VKRGAALMEEIDRTISPTPVLWWLGQRGFILRFATVTFYIDPHLSGSDSLLDPATVRHADMVLVTSAGSIDAQTVPAILDHSRGAKLILPKSAADTARAAGIGYERMTTTDADLRVEYFKDNLYGRVYAIPSAQPALDRTALGGYPYLGYLIRFGRWTVYFSGGCAVYDSLADRLRPFNVSVALLPVGGANFSISDAAGLASSIGATWMVPVPGGDAEQTVCHLLGHHPEQPFKIFEVGEKWTVPEE
jgi:L-ascorbate metabolism protein UlaG (beta-lactamase superfamily)